MTRRWRDSVTLSIGDLIKELEKHARRAAKDPDKVVNWRGISKNHIDIHVIYMVKHINEQMLDEIYEEAFEEVRNG